MGRLLGSGSQGSYQFVEKINNMWKVLPCEIEFEDLYEAENGNTEKLDHFFQSLKEFPAYRYVILYLCESLSKAYEQSELDLMFTELEAGKVPGKRSDEILTELATGLCQRYEENVGKKLYEVEEIKEKIIDFDEHFLMEFLIWTTVEDDITLDAFLTGVLKRQSFDFYDQKEFLTYVAFRYEFKGAYSRHEIYERLMKIYEELPVEDRKSKAEKPEGTIAIQREADDLLDEEALGIEPGAVSPALEKFLQWHKALEKPGVRTVVKRYETLFAEVQRLYHTDVMNFCRICEKLKGEAENEEKKGLLSYLRENHQIGLTVSYDGTVLPGEPGKEEGDTAVLFRAGTEFAGENFIYTLREDARLPRRRIIEDVPVSVASLSELPAPGREATLPSGAELFLCDSEGNVEKALTEKYEITVRAFPPGKTKNAQWQGKQKPAYNKEGDKKGKGWLLLSGKAGLELPANGTYFVYIDQGKRYLFALKENAALTWTQDIYPYYLELDVQRRLGEKKREHLPTVREQDINSGNVMERAGISYKISGPHERDGHVTGLWNIVSIKNPDKVVYKACETEAEMSHREDKGKPGESEKALQLRVIYPAGQELLLPRGTKFQSVAYFKKGKAVPLKPGEQNLFELRNDECLPAKNQWKLRVQVVSTDSQKRAGVTEEFLRPDRCTFAWEKACPDNTKKSGDETGVLSVECADKRPRLYGSQTEGYLELVCECGTVIDRSFTFYGKMDGQTYCFVPVSDHIAVDEAQVEATISVYPTTEKPGVSKRHVFSRLSDGACVIAKADSIYRAFGEKGRDFSKLKISSDEKYSWMDTSSAGEAEKEDGEEQFLRYLTAEDDLELFSRYIPGLAPESFQADWFSKLLIRHWSEEELGKLSPSRMRSALMTLLFLKAAREKELTYSEDVEFSEYLRRFARQVNTVMEECRMDEFYPGRPCDCLLAYLFVSDSPADALRILFKLNNKEVLSADSIQ